MASTDPEVSHEPGNRIRFKSVKALSESPELTSIPSSYTFTTKPDDEVVTDPDDDDPIPVIDYSLLVTGTPDQRAKTIYDIGKACEDWGFFMLINHSVSTSLMEKMVDQVFAFFNLKEEEKQEYAGKDVMDPVRYGTSFNASMDKVLFWRDFLKIVVHPEFHSPCPQPELAMGMPPHSDHGLLNLLMQNGVSGLQVLHNGKWINVSSTPNCFLVLVSDHLEIISNGKYKSVLHRAVVSNKATRMSLASVIAPSLDTVVEPASELIDNQSNPATYVGMRHREYMELQRSNHLYGKSVIDQVKIII